jgi:endoglucanase Acf2
LTLAELQDAASPTITAADWDDLSVTMKFTAAPAGPTVNFPLVKGSPYITAQVPSPAKPLLRAPRAGAGGGSIGSVTRVAPNKLKIVMQQIPFSGQHTWLFWASKPINFTVVGSATQIWDAKSTAGTFAGTLRLAWMPNVGAAGAAAIETMLDSYVDAVPVGGSVTAWFNLGQTLTGGTGSYRLSWSTTSMTSPGSPPGQQLLMLALPHHIDTLAVPAAAASNAEAFPLGIVSAAAAAGSASTATTGSSIYAASASKMRNRRRRRTWLAQTAAAGSSAAGSAGFLFGAYITSVRGPMVPVVGACWLLQERLAPLTSDVQVAAANLKSASMRADIQQTLLVS